LISGQHYGAYGVLLIYFLANAYFYVRLIRSLKPSPAFRWTLGIILFVLFLSFPAGKFLGGVEYNLFDYLLTLVSSVWMGFTLFFLTCAGMYELLLLFWERTFNRGKSVLLPQTSFGPVIITLICAFVVFLGGCALREAQHISITHIEVPLRNLPVSLDGISVVQVSDVHYGMLTENEKLAKLVRSINALHPDIIVFTGDLVDEKISHMEQMIGPLSQLRARWGVYAVLGNHEYYAGAGRVTNILREAKIHLLRNAIAVLPGGIQILGIDDPAGFKRVGEPKPDFERLISSLDPQKPSILLYHPPWGFEKAASGHVGLQLSGHTHGAQILPIRPVAQIWFPYLRGLHQLGESYLYVSRGIGTGGPPMRLGSIPEIVEIRLRNREMETGSKT
jgi:uncharacterized protein